MDSRPVHTLDTCRDLDRRDPLAGFRERFAFARSGTIHFDANSVGAMPTDVPDRVQHLLTDCWRDLGRRSWGSGDWLDRPRYLGASIAHMIGVNPEDVIVCDNTTVNLFKVLCQAWKLRRSGHVILTETHNFPTDLHVVQGFQRLLADLGVDGEVRMAESRSQLLDMLKSDVAVLYLTQTDYRTSERWNISRMSELARTADALTIWDLSHSAGALDIDLASAGADFAVGCGYKYLCGGPGGPAFVYMNPCHQGATWPTIAGWMGHAEWHRFLPLFEPANSISSQLTGTPQVIANEVFAAAADIWREVERPLAAQKHESLTETLIALLDQECSSLGVEIVSPRSYSERGGHVAFSHPGAGPVCEAMAANGLVGSFRAPNSIRLGMSPLYHGHVDAWNAVEIIRDVLEREIWMDPCYQKVSI